MTQSDSLDRLLESVASGGDRLRARVQRGELPERYADQWEEPFLTYAVPALAPGARILDVGSGRRPTLPPDVRPQDTFYVGLDVDEGELRAARPEAYDKTVVTDVGVSVDGVPGSFDLIISWQVLEHVKSLAGTVENLRGLLSPGGRLVFMVSGRYSAFALLGRYVPHRARVGAMSRLIKADPDTKFPTVYDRCYATALEDALSGFSSLEILPRYRGADYFRFWKPLELAYLQYENWAVRTGKRNLATHYVVLAVR